MEVTLVDEAIELLEKANADLEPELLSGPAARRLLDAYARAQRLAAYGVAALARKLDDASELSRVTGTSMARAKDTVAVGKVLGSADELSDALQHGDISLDQAAEIAKAEETCPDASKELLAVAQEEAFHVLRDKARKLKLEAEQHNGLAGHQRAARSARSYGDELGMVHLHITLEPHVGTPIVARAEAEAARRARAADRKELEWCVLRRHRSSPATPLVPQHPHRGRCRLGAGATALFRRGGLRGLQQPLPHRVRPRATTCSARGPSSHENLKPRCWGCHQTKTARDRRAGKLKPPEP